MTNDLSPTQILQASYYKFFQEFWDVIEPEPLVENWHIKYLCNEVQDVAERVIRRQPKLYDLVINIPPGETKSTLVTVMLHPWLWIRDPTLRIISTSYSGGLALDHAVKSRDIIKSDKYRSLFGNIAIKSDQDTKGYYKNVYGGDRAATSTGGTITGRHGHLIIVDDPLNPKESVSDADRATANEYIKQTLSTRKVDKAITPTILIMQRLHHEDPTHQMLQRENVKHICLPGEQSDNIIPEELVEHYSDGLFNPKRLDHDVLQEIKDELGSYGFAGQIQQRPSPEEGGKWKQWFIPVPDAEFPSQQSLSNYGTDWDTAFTEKEENSASAFVTSGMMNGNMYIHRLGAVWKEFPELITFMQTLPSPHYVEAKASGKSAKQTLRSNGIPAIEVKVDGGADKIARANAATPRAEAGFVYVKESLLGYLYHDEKQGILKFPVGPNDDLADALAQAIQRHYSRPKIDFAPRQRRKKRR
jgi:hypothetical protein